jgi:hypothetical protein
MNPITQQMIWLIEQGLHGDNLRELARLADQMAPAMPATYVTLWIIFRALADESDDQGVETSRYHAVTTTLQDPVLDLLRAEGEPANVLFERLNAVLEGFHRLRF